MQQTVRLLGDLGERYGAEHEYYNLKSPAEAIKLLCINKPEFMQELCEAHQHGIGYRVIQAGTDLDYPDLRLPLGSHDLIVTPIVAGSGGGGGIGKILVGVGLIAASFLLPGAGLFGATSLFGATAVAGGIGTALGTAFSAIGASLILGGVSEIIAPQPEIPDLGGMFARNRFLSAESTSTDGPQSVTRGTDGRQSYAYTGAANTVGVGAVIPVAYGEVLSGSHLLSATVEVADDSDPLKTAIKTPGQQTILVGGETLNFGSFQTASGVKVRRTSMDFGGNNEVIKQKRTHMSLTPGTLVSGFTGQLDKRSNERTEFDFVFFLSNGLHEPVSGAGSTLVDAFFTYRLSIFGNFEDGPNQLLGSSQATVQGLLLAGQTYKWQHRMEHGDGGGLEAVFPQVEIVEARALSGQTLFWQSYGYRLFNRYG
jgi:predicted phage tail protein